MSTFSQALPSRSRINWLISAHFFSEDGLSVVAISFSCARVISTNRFIFIFYIFLF